MSHSQEHAQKILNLEEHQMYLKRQVDLLASEVLELSRLLKVAQADIRRLDTALATRKVDGSAPDPQADNSNEQA